jgi:hypothetical protein
MIRAAQANTAILDFQAVEAIATLPQLAIFARLIANPLVPKADQSGSFQTQVNAHSNFRTWPGRRNTAKHALNLILDGIFAASMVVRHFDLPICPRTLRQDSVAISGGFLQSSSKMYGGGEE